MRTGAWLREDRADVAVDKLLDAAGEAFAELGVRATSMADVAHAAGCSRGTLYRYFESRHALQVAYINRAALRLARHIYDEVTSISDPRTRLVETVLLAVRSVRADPRLAVWFTPSDMGVATEFSRDSEVLDAIALGFTRGLDGLPAPPATLRGDGPRPQARWVVRVIVSLLTMPADDEDDERDIVERFVLPSVFAAGSRSVTGPADQSGSTR